MTGIYAVHYASNYWAAQGIVLGGISQDSFNKQWSAKTDSVTSTSGCHDFALILSWLQFLFASRFCFFELMETYFFIDLMRIIVKGCKFDRNPQKEITIYR